MNNRSCGGGSCQWYEDVITYAVYLPYLLQKGDMDNGSPLYLGTENVTLYWYYIQFLCKNDTPDTCLDSVNDQYF